MNEWFKEASLSDLVAETQRGNCRNMREKNSGLKALRVKKPQVRNKLDVFQKQMSNVPAGEGLEDGQEKADYDSLMEQGFGGCDEECGLGV